MEREMKVSEIRKREGINGIRANKNAEQRTRKRSAELKCVESERGGVQTPNTDTIMGGEITKDNKGMAGPFMRNG